MLAPGLVPHASSIPGRQWTTIAYWPMACMYVQELILPAAFRLARVPGLVSAPSPGRE